MKFINYLESISGVGIYPMISLLLFVAFFIAVTIWAYKRDKQFLNHMESLPIDNANTDKP